MGRVVVVGAGVIGLSCAVRLLETGHRVDVVARDLPLETTSAVAAALWYPYLADPPQRVTGWSAACFTTLAGLAQDPATGVRLTPGRELFAVAQPDPWWREAVAGFGRAEPASLPEGYVDGFSFRSPVVEMPRYLTWLRARVEDLGGTVTRLNLAALPPTGEDRGLVVNAAGLGARLLARDLTLTPVRGQVVVLEQCGVQEWLLDGSAAAPCYVIPRSRDIVVGGTEVHGEWSRTPEPETAERILADACRHLPALRGARVISHRVGLRPARPEVRLERVGEVIHCYGHGGSGVTLSWGCADEVAALAG